MAIHGKRRLFVLALLFGCAHAGGTGASTPKRIGVVVVSPASGPSPQRMLDGLFGPAEPGSLLLQETVRTLGAKGLEPSSLGLAGPEAELRGGAVSALLRDEGLDALLVITLRRFDVGALEPLGKTEVDLQVELLGPEAESRWKGGYQGVTNVSLYRAKNDWTVHLRSALRLALRDLP